MPIDHINIVTADMERSLAFYVGLLGMQITFETTLTGSWIETVTGLPGVTARAVFCQPIGGGTRLELLEYQRPPGTSLPDASIANTLGLRHFALNIDDIEAWHTRLSAAGVTFISAPVTVPFPVAGRTKRLCYLHDPDGALIELADYRA